MNTQPLTPIHQASKASLRPNATPEPKPKPWIKPTFERLPLKDALAGPGILDDGLGDFS